MTAISAFVLRLGGLVGAVLSLSPVAADAGEVTVFAAASLAEAVETIADGYRSESGATIRLSLAASSTLARQIEAGAPADLFLSASEEWMDYLAARGLVDATTRVNAVGNRLALIVPADSAVGNVAVDSTLDLAALLGATDRLAVGDPDHVPAGIYAKQALETLGFWDALESRLARADDVRAALALVASGEAPFGIVYATDAAISDKVRVAGLFPEDSHDPIRYPFAIVAGSDGKAASGFLAYLTGPTGMAVFERFGFSTDE